MNAQEIVLNPEEQAELSRRVRSATISQRDGRRARVILLAAQGCSRIEIARLTGFSLPTITCWCQRFQTLRLDGLVQYQSSFAGDSDRQHVETATFQPFVIHNLAKGWYLRSTGTWTFDLKNDTHFIPIGLGVGKVWKSGANILNTFVEPQWTVERKGMVYRNSLCLPVSTSPLANKYTFKGDLRRKP